MADQTFIPLPPDPEQRIARLYAWIAIHSDGSEGIMATLTQGRVMPLVTSQRRIAISMAEMAERVALASAAAGRPCRAELRVFDYSSRAQSGGSGA